MKTNYLKIYLTLSIFLLVGVGCSRTDPFFRRSSQVPPANLESISIDTSPIILVEGTPLVDGILNKTHVSSQDPCPDPFPEVTIKVPVDTITLTQQAISRTPEMVEQPPSSYKLWEKSDIIDAPQTIRPDEPFTLSFNCRGDISSQNFLSGVLVYEPVLEVYDLPLNDLIYNEPVEIRFNISISP